MNMKKPVKKSKKRSAPARSAAPTASGTSKPSPEQQPDSPPVPEPAPAEAVPEPAMADAVPEAPVAEAPEAPVPEPPPPPPPPQVPAPEPLVPEPLIPPADLARINFEFRRRVARKIEGNLAGFCYQCGACVGDCPAATYSDGAFNPRTIMLKVLYGLGDELLVADSILWSCTNCYNCHERCPQQVKPVEVIISLKNLLADSGICPDPVEKVIATFESSGRTVPLSGSIDRQRQQYGLPPLSAIPMDEIRALIEPSPERREKA